MNIRTRLTVTFFFVVIIVLSAICLSIYFFSESYREEDFYRRLKNRATNTVKVLVEIKEVNADLLKRMERNNPASLPNQYIAIYNDSSRELYNSEGIQRIKADTAFLHAILSEDELRFTQGNLEALGFVWKDSVNRLSIIAAASDIYGLDAVRNLRNILIGTVCASILIVSILGWFFAGRALAPISKIVSQVAHITDRNLSERLDEGNQVDELSKLSQTFNQMLEGLQGAFESQKTFIANASHEIKTPITAMSAEIEVSLLQRREHEYYLRVLNSVLLRLKDLDKLSTQLLTLAQTSAEQPRRNFSNFRIDDVLWEVKDELLIAFPHYKIDIGFSLKINPYALVIFGDIQLIKVAVFNLIDNACKYSINNSVSVAVESDDLSYTIIRFINTGNGIGPDQLEKIFEPFYRGPESRDIKGSGIGLSLVNRIVALHRGTVTVQSASGGLTEFMVRLPSSPDVEV